jgi:hypothetical protein
MTVSWQWFWYVLLGFILGGFTVYLWGFLKEKAIKLVWYEWVLVLLSFAVFLLLGQTFIASYGEGQPQAAWMSLVFMGVPIIIMMVGAFRSLRTRLPKA